jgi:D-proline reductase (dithiol) PrdB
MDIVENLRAWQDRYKTYQKHGAAKDEISNDYPYVVNKFAPFTPARRALPMLNLALISSAGAYIDGTEEFNVESKGGDATFREIPIEVEAEDLKYSARGYNPAAVLEDRNVQIPIERLLEYEANAVIGQLNPVWWSFNGFIPDVSRLTETLIPNLVERVKRYEVQAALLIPASLLCHQSVALIARALEQENIPTMMIGVDREILEDVN